jgi:hypothetical protein
MRIVRRHLQINFDSGGCDGIGSKYRQGISPVRMKDPIMTKSNRTTAELWQEIAEDRREDLDFESALRKEVYSGRITVMEALERLRDHLASDHESGPVEACTHDGKEVV